MSGKSNKSQILLILMRACLYMYVVRINFDKGPEYFSILYYSCTILSERSKYAQAQCKRAIAKVEWFFSKKETDGECRRVLLYSGTFLERPPPLGIKYGLSIKTSGLWWQVQLQWNVYTEIKKFLP